MASSSSNSPCAACKFLRRKCQADCVFAPYFPPDQPQKFANVHKVFGASNVTKLLNELHAHQREDAVNSLAYEADMRLRDPVYGCVGVISVLQRQLRQLQMDLTCAKSELSKYQSVNITAGHGLIAAAAAAASAAHGAHPHHHHHHHMGIGLLTASTTTTAHDHHHHHHQFFSTASSGSRDHHHHQQHGGLMRTAFVDAAASANGTTAYDVMAAMNVSTNIGSLTHHHQFHQQPRTAGGDDRIAP
ncbi:hypothetical protein Syun_005726 [Stephania yunnanensis]|uniref:LOB domain-containing protein n=1 Tax=Stephania yunnanensis TaxID=152371 RepID=A0AAP0PXY9_9MAGN